MYQLHALACGSKLAEPLPPLTYTHLNVYAVPSVSSDASDGVSPITEAVKLSLSVTLKAYIDSSPVLTRNLGAPLIAGGKFTESMWGGRREDYSH